MVQAGRASEGAAQLCFDDFDRTRKYRRLYMPTPPASPQASGLTPTDIATIIAGVAAALGLGEYVRSLFRRTIGRRSDLMRRLRRLGTGAQLDFFESVLGEPPAIRRSFERDQPDWGVPREEGASPPVVPRPYVECIFVNALCYVQTVSDRDNTVVGFSITTRRRSFHPKLSFPNNRPPSRWAQLILFGRLLVFAIPSHAELSRRERLMGAIRYDRPIGRRRQGGTQVELGRTTFERARPMRNPRIQSSRGNKHWCYVEAYWGGNPGYYQHVVFAASRGSPVARYPDGIETREWDDRPWLETDGPEWIKRARSTGVITTMAVIGMSFDVEAWPQFGPSVDQMRTLP